MEAPPQLPVKFVTQLSLTDVANRRLVYSILHQSESSQKSLQSCRNLPIAKKMTSIIAKKLTSHNFSCKPSVKHIVFKYSRR